MGIEEIREDIIGNAKKGADSILKTAEKERERLISQAKSEIGEYKRQKTSSAAEKINAYEGVKRATVEFEKKKISMLENKRLLSKVSAESLKAVESFDKKTRKKHLAKLLAKARRKITIGKILCNPKDKDIIGFPKVESADILGGLVAESKDGSVRIDLSYDTLLQDAFNKNLKHVCKILFG
ncbi:MAG: hypothetical protein KKF44_00690 [Nanoarchaeota archaeon]|nr:hypothetical protein [Nanoarchaeota archaeon]